MKGHSSIYETNNDYAWFNTPHNHSCHQNTISNNRSNVVKKDKNKQLNGIKRRIMGKAIECKKNNNQKPESFYIMGDDTHYATNRDTLAFVKKFYMNKKECNDKSNNNDEISSLNNSGCSSLSKERKLQLMNKLKFSSVGGSQKNQKIFNYNIFANNAKRGESGSNHKLSKEVSPDNIIPNNLSKNHESFHTKPANTSSKVSKTLKKNLENSSKEYFSEIKKTSS